MVYQLAVVPGGRSGDCYARVERTTASQVVISCAPEKGWMGPNWKFLYDARAKALVGQFQYYRIPLDRVSVSGQKAVFVSGTLSPRQVTVEFEPERGDSFRVRPGLQTAGEPERRVVPFASGSRFALVIEPQQGPVVEEGSGPARQRYLLPQATYDEFAAARPGRVKDGYVREHTRMLEAIGPWQMADGTLWFAKTFCDGEGITGVGGFGYFDLGERRYKVYVPAEVVNWSATSILVERDAVWIGVAYNGEWGSTGGGLLRFDRSTEKTETLKLRDIVGGIARIGDRLVMATETGLAVLEGGRIRCYFVDQSSAGQLSVVEASIGR